MTDYRELIATSDDGRYRAYIAPDVDAENPRIDDDGTATVVIRWKNYGTPNFVSDDVWPYVDESGAYRVVDNMADSLNWQGHPYYGNADVDTLAEWTDAARSLFGADAWIAFVSGDPRDGTVARITEPFALTDPAALVHQFGIGADPAENVPVPVDHADGIVVVSTETCRRSGVKVPVSAERAADFIDADMAEGNAWARGDVYGWIVTRVDADGREDDVDSVGGYYGTDYATDEARDMLAWHVEQDARCTAWILAEADYRLAVPDVPTMLAGWRVLSERASADA